MRSDFRQDRLGVKGKGENEILRITPEQSVAISVLQDEKVVGLVIGDLVKWVISSQNQAIQALDGLITSTYSVEGDFSFPVPRPSGIALPQFYD